GNIDFYGVGDTWNESVMTVEEETSSLKIMGGDADVDEFLQQTYSNVNNLRALAVEKKAKQMAYTFNDTFFNSDSAIDPHQFDGLKKLAAAARTFSKGANGSTLALDHMDELIDYIKPGKPDVLFMSRRSRRKLSSLRRASGNLLETSVDAFGRRV